MHVALGEEEKPLEMWHVVKGNAAPSVERSSQQLW